MNDKPGFWQWQRYLLRDWHAPANEPSLNDTLMFAIRMATWAEDGERIYVSAGKLAQCARVSVRTAKEYRKRALRLGILAETGQKQGGVRVLCIALPLHACTGGAESCTGRGAESCTQLNREHSIRKSVQNPARPSSDVRNERASEAGRTNESSSQASLSAPPPNRSAAGSEVSEANERGEQNLDRFPAADQWTSPPDVDSDYLRERFHKPSESRPSTAWRKHLRDAD
jgi:hypothetical protein